MRADSPPPDSKRHGRHPSNGDSDDKNILTMGRENTLALLTRKLNDKRKEMRRPEEISVFGTFNILCNCFNSLFIINNFRRMKLDCCIYSVYVF